MIRIGIEASDDFLSRVQRRTNEVFSNVYDEIDADSILPDWLDDEPQIKHEKPEKMQNFRKFFFPPYFSEKSILLNTVYPDYSYPNRFFYK